MFFKIKTINKYISNYYSTTSYCCPVCGATKDFVCKYIDFKKAIEVGCTSCNYYSLVSKRSRKTHKMALLEMPKMRSVEDYYRSNFHNYLRGNLQTIPDYFLYSPEQELPRDDSFFLIRKQEYDKASSIMKMHKQILPYHSMVFPTTTNSIGHTGYARVGANTKRIISVKEEPQRINCSGIAMLCKAVPQNMPALIGPINRQKIYNSPVYLVDNIIDYTMFVGKRDVELIDPDAMPIFLEVDPFKACIDYRMYAFSAKYSMSSYRGGIYYLRTSRSIGIVHALELQSPLLPLECEDDITMLEISRLSNNGGCIYE